MLNIQSEIYAFAENFSNFDVFKVEEIIFEVYRESRTEEGWEVPCSVIGIRLFVDGEEKQDVILNTNADYGLLSYTSLKRPKTHVDFALHTANFICDFIFLGFEAFEYKIKKRFKSDMHIYHLDVPSNFIVDMPPPNELNRIKFNFVREKHKLEQKMKTIPSDELTQKLIVLQSTYDEQLTSYFKENPLP